MNITFAQIEALMIDAGVHGDDVMVEICRRAMDGYVIAMAECERVITDEAVQHD